MIIVRYIDNLLLLLIINRSNTQQISKDIEDTNNTINKVDLIYIYKILCLTTAKCKC